MVACLRGGDRGRNHRQLFCNHIRRENHAPYSMPYSMQVESGLQSALNRHTVRLFKESDDTKCCNNTICPPEDEQGTARNMLRIIM